MRFIISTFFVTFIFLQTQAQDWIVDSVDMGPGYEYDVFYDLEAGAIVQTSPNTTWDLAFFVNSSGQNSFSASILANHSQPSTSMGLGMYVFSAHRTSAEWGTMGLADTSFLSQPLWNDENDYDYGAFNRNADSSDIFDFGWGKYFSTNHNLYGDSIYIIEKNGAYYKFVVDSMLGATSGWYARIARLDGSDEKAITLNTSSEYSTKIFAYYDIETNTILDREPSKGSWHLHFSKYAPLVFFQGIYLHYPLAGPLVHRGYMQAEYAGENPDNASAKIAADAEYQYDYSLSTWKWRKPGTNDTVGNLSYFIKPYPDSSIIYQILYTGISGAASGKMYFQYRKFENITAVNVHEEYISKFSIYPNPAITDELVVHLNTEKELGNTKICIWNSTGQLVSYDNSFISKGDFEQRISIEGLNSGLYILSLESAGSVILSKTFQNIK